MLGSSIQYFEDLENLFTTLLDLASPSGSVYIVDSPIYNNEVAALAAKNRSLKYFDALGFPTMVQQYFHHTFEDLTNFNYEVRYNPNSIISKISRKLLKKPLSVFPIIVLKK